MLSFAGSEFEWCCFKWLCWDESVWSCFGREEKL